jgi:hypothetical protein
MDFVYFKNLTMRTFFAVALIFASAWADTTITVSPFNVYSCASGQINICMGCCPSISFKLPQAAVACTQVLNNNFFAAGPISSSQNISLAYTYDGTSSISFFRTGSGSAPTCGAGNSLATYAISALEKASGNSVGVTMSSTGSSGATTTAISCNSNQGVDAGSTCSATPATCSNVFTGTCPFTAKIAWYSFSAYTVAVPSPMGKTNSSSVAIAGSSAALAAAAAASALFLL